MASSIGLAVRAERRARLSGELYQVPGRTPEPVGIFRGFDSRRLHSSGKSDASLGMSTEWKGTPMPYEELKQRQSVMWGTGPYPADHGDDRRHP
jgi:hypothetical protein